jgi:hypothetical protein
MEQTFEQVNAHVEKYYSTIPKAAGPKETKISIDKLKQLYVVARPILSLVANLGIIPKKWRSTIGSLISVLDILTAQTDES